MTTQADSLQLLAAAPARRAGAPLIGVTGGKGGIGKSTIAANLAIALARGVRRGVAPDVLLVDCDLGLSSLDAILNFPRRRNISDAMDRRLPMRQCILRAQGGVNVLLAPRGIERFASLDTAERASLILQLNECSRARDVTILDLPAGIHADGLALAHSADYLIVVVTPDPASLADAYAVIKIAKERAAGTRIGLLVNQAPGPVAARQLTDRFAAIAKRFLEKEIEPLGWVPRDPAVSRATLARNPVVLSEPGSPAAAAIRVFAGRVSGVLETLRRERDADSSAWM
ncbi:MAG: P-loop NTPase [Planctomycetes bacterium]|nr:P-loop NTPase [Planctomycetota bacterium]